MKVIKIKIIWCIQHHFKNFKGAAGERESTFKSYPTVINSVVYMQVRFLIHLFPTSLWIRVFCVSFQKDETGAWMPAEHWITTEVSVRCQSRLVATKRNLARWMLPVVPRHQIRAVELRTKLLAEYSPYSPSNAFYTDELTDCPHLLIVRQAKCHKLHIGLAVIWE